LALTQSCVTVPHLLQHVARHLLRLHQGCVTRVSVEQGGLKSYLFTHLFSQNPRLPHVPNDGRPGVSIATARSPSLSITWFLPHHHLSSASASVAAGFYLSFALPSPDRSSRDYSTTPSHDPRSSFTRRRRTRCSPNQPTTHSFSISLRCHNDHFL
jgi:hypothetical protein